MFGFSLAVTVGSGSSFKSTLHQLPQTETVPPQRKSSHPKGLLRGDSLRSGNVGSQSEAEEH
jgi:hypothetical protein